MEQSRLEAIKTGLEEELASVVRQLEEHGATVDGDEVNMPVEEGFADSAQATTERSAILSLIEQLHASHREIVEALSRIEQGTYGKCERCGQAIPIERLEAIPTARLCVACKQALRG